MAVNIKNKLFETRDYSIFKRSRGNRPVDKAHVAQLKKLIADKDIGDPVKVNRGLEVIDGQHTLQARRELGLPVPYIIINSNDPLDIARFNTGRKNWSMESYLGHHCARGKMDYKICRQKMDQWGFPVSETMILLLKGTSGHKRMTNDFKLGNFKIPAGGIANIDRIGFCLNKLRQYFVSDSDSKRRLKRSVISAYIICDRHPQFDRNRFEKACKSKSALFLKGTSRNDFIEIFQKIYNGGLTRSKRINLLDWAINREYETFTEE